MLSKLKYILDIGSSSLRLLAVSSYNKLPKIIAEEQVLYDGFLDGEFLTPEKLEDNFIELIEKMTAKIRKPISKIIVGVPNDFCVCVCKRISRKFTSLHKVTDSDIQNLYESNLSFGDSEEYVVMNYSPMQFTLDDTITTLNPVGSKINSLVLDASYILAKKSFIESIKQKFYSVKIKDVEFISTSLGQAIVCEPVKSNKPFAIVDVGHITTNLSVYKGEGMALVTSFGMGGGHVSSDIMQLLNLSFKDAELIKRKVVLTIENNKNEYYEICSKGKLIKAPINMTNQIVKSRIEMIAKVINNILTINEVFKDIDIYLTGDGIANFKGVKNIIKEITNLNVYDFKVPFDNSKDKYQTSKIGLAVLANEAI